MSRPRIFISGELKPGDVVEIPESERRHLKVRRIASGEIVVLNGRGTEAKGRLLGKERLLIEEVRTPEDRELSIRIHLFMALIKRDKMELVIQKATELGVYSITPVIMERCVVKPKNTERWLKIAVEALKQCGRTRLPLINPPTELEKVELRGIGFLLWEEAEARFERIVTPSEDVSVIVGPEGGITSQEAEILKKKGAVPSGLGEVILRAETAAIYAVSVIRALSIRSAP